MRRIMTIILFVIVLMLGAGFSAINLTPVDINYYLGVLSLPLSMVIIAAIILGTILGALALSTSILRLRYENRRLRKKLISSEQEINSLRILPITDAGKV
ncbi:MAG: LapA family protein [Pseudomonadota bacterium]|nr:LapA family protein [Pseudomonadota bacterium]